MRDWPLFHVGDVWLGRCRHGARRVGLFDGSFLFFLHLEGSVNACFRRHAGRSGRGFA